jgi:exosortase A-associated hydrolase 1
MSFAERALTFPCSGDELVAVVADPDTAAARVAVLVVVGGPQYRAGSHRQFVLFARRLAEAGYPVMRFDCRGMGDSAGDARTFEQCDADIAAAIDCLRVACPATERVVLWGLCDAASAALLYWHSTKDPRIAGIVLLNPWVRSETSLAKTHIKHYYGRRLLERDFWAKLVRGDVDAAGALRGLAGNLATATRRGGERDARGEALPYQARMALGLQEFPGPVLLILSGRDLTASEFIDHTRADRTWLAAMSRPNVERRDIEEADHTFSTSQWSRDVEAHTLRWLSASVLARS